MDSRASAIAMWEDGLVAFEHTLRRACMERNAECACAEAVRQDYLAKTRAFTISYRRSFCFDRILEECKILLSLQEIDLERWEEKLKVDQAHSLPFYDG
jgi:hypothetical protein